MTNISVSVHGINVSAKYERDGKGAVAVRWSRTDFANVDLQLFKMGVHRTDRARRQEVARTAICNAVRAAMRSVS